MTHVLVAFLLLLSTTVFGAPEADLQPTLCRQPPTLDGRLDDICWERASRTTNFTLPGELTAVAKTVEAFVGYDDENLYMAFRCEEPEPDRLLLRHRQDHPDIWQDDVIEVFLRTGGDRMAIDQLLVNAAGARWSLRRRPGGHQPWRPDWPAAARINEDHWVVELAVPWTDIGVEKALPGRLIEVKFGREDYASGGRLSVWPPGVEYAGIDGYGRFFLEPANRLQEATWEISTDGSTLGPRLNLTTEPRGTDPRATANIRLRPRTPHELLAVVDGTATIEMTVGGQRTTQSIDGHDTLRWAGVATDEGDLSLELSLLAGTADIRLQLLEAARLPVAGPAIRVQGGRTTRIEHVAIKDARAVRGFIGTPFDGTRASRSWDGRVWEYPQAGAGAGVGYAYHGNDGLHVQLADADGFDAIQIHGGIRADLHVPAISYRDRGDSEALHRFAGGTLRSRALFDDRLHTSNVSFTGVTDGVIADAAFFRIHDANPAPSAAPSAAPSGASWPLGQTWAPDVPLGVDALGILFNAGRAPDAATLTVQDPLDHRLQLMTVDIQIDGAGPAQVVLDVINQLIPANTPITVVATDADGHRWTDGEVVLYAVSPAIAHHQALAHRKFLVKTFFACLSEPRPWTGLPREGSIEAWFARHRMGDQLSQLFAAVANARRIDPFDDEMRQYDEWLHRNRQTPAPVEPTPIAPRPIETATDLPVTIEPSAAGQLAPGSATLSTTSPPEWALWARTAWLTARRVPAWWLDHRLVETGEFGGAVGDDTDLFQNFVDFAYFEHDGIAMRLQEAAARLAHLAELTTLTDGVNRRTMDPLHAYEEGLNQEALMAAWSFADPVYIERCMMAARSVADLTTVTEQGHRHFRSQLIGHDARTVATTDVDGQAHPSMWHPALEVLWFNEHPLVSGWLQEWAHGWLDHFEPEQYAHAVEVGSERVEGVNARPLYGGYGGQGSAFAFLATITGDRTFAAPFFESYEHGQTSTSPGDLVLDFLHRFGPKAFGDHLGALPLESPAAAVVHGDLKALVDALKKDVAEIQQFERMYTSAEPFTDRIFLQAIRNAAICYTGGFASRNKFNRSHAVSWSGLGTDYAAFVEGAGPEQFRARLYNFSPAPLEGAARFWQLGHGRYRVRQGPDLDDDGHIDDQIDSAGDMIIREMVIRRGDPVPVGLQPGGTVIDIECIQALPPLSTRPDLALSPLDITTTDGVLTGFVHNIGRQPARAVVTLTPAGGGVPRTVDLGVIESPDDLIPRRLEFHFRNLTSSDLDGVLQVDQQEMIEEITEQNNLLDLRDAWAARRWISEVEASIAAAPSD